MLKNSFAKAYEEMPKSLVSDTTISSDISHTIKLHKMHKLATWLFTFLKPPHVPLPHLAEQFCIVAKVYQLKALYKKLGTTPKESNTTHHGLPKTLIHMALDPMVKALETVK